MRGNRIFIILTTYCTLQNLSIYVFCITAVPNLPDSNSIVTKFSGNVHCLAPRGGAKTKQSKNKSTVYPNMFDCLLWYKPSSPKSLQGNIHHWSLFLHHSETFRLLQAIWRRGLTDACQTFMKTLYPLVGYCDWTQCWLMFAPAIEKVNLNLSWLFV